MIGKKRKSHMRFEQVNHLVDRVLPTLPGQIEGLVLMVGWRHANSKSQFRKSTCELARTCGITKRHMQRVLDRMEESGVIKTVSQQRGTIPRIYEITGHVWSPRGDTHVTSSKNARGDIRDT